MARTKRAVVGQQLPERKRAVVGPAPATFNEGRVSWRFGSADMNGPWRWGAMTPEAALRIFGFMAEMDKLTWAETQQGFRPRSKRVESAGVCAEAQQRLREIGKGDCEFLDEWHVSGVERIWGIRVGQVCNVLWWDPDHTVWPSAR